MIFSESTSITNITRYNRQGHTSPGGGRSCGAGGQRAPFQLPCKWEAARPCCPGVCISRHSLLLGTMEHLSWDLLTAVFKMSAPDGLVVTFSQNSWEPLPTFLRDGEDNFLKCWLTEQNVLRLVTDFFPLLHPPSCCKTTYGDSNFGKKLMTLLRDNTSEGSDKLVAKWEKYIKDVYGVRGFFPWFFPGDAWRSARFSIPIRLPLCFFYIQGVIRELGNWSYLWSFPSKHPTFSYSPDRLKELRTAFSFILI